MSLYNVSKFDKVYIPKDKVDPPIIDVGKHGAGISSVIMNDDNTQNNTADGNYSFCAGFTNNSTGQYSGVGGGAWNTASGEGSFVVGLQNQAVGQAATSIGRRAYSYGAHSLAGGYESVAYGDDSIAFGENCSTGSDTKNAKHSVALGKNTHTNGENSLTIGDNITSNNNNSLWIGKNSRGESGNTMFGIGNGKNNISVSNGLECIDEPVTGSLTTMSIILNNNILLNCGKSDYYVYSYAKRNSTSNRDAPGPNYHGEFKYFIYGDRININILVGNNDDEQSHDSCWFYKRHKLLPEHLFFNKIDLRVNFEEIKKILEAHAPAGKSLQISNIISHVLTLSVTYSDDEEGEVGVARSHLNRYITQFITPAYETTYKDILLTGGSFFDYDENGWFDKTIYDNQYLTPQSGETSPAYVMYNPSIDKQQIISIDIGYDYYTTPTQE